MRRTKSQNDDAAKILTCRIYKTKKNNLKNYSTVFMRAELFRSTGRERKEKLIMKR